MLNQIDKIKEAMIEDQIFLDEAIKNINGDVVRYFNLFAKKFLCLIIRKKQKIKTY